MQLFIAATPQQLLSARRYTPRLAHIAYRVGEDGSFQRSPLSTKVHGGIMLLYVSARCRIQSVEELCLSIIQECDARGYSGIAVEMEGSLSSSQSALLQSLSQQLVHQRLYVSEQGGNAVNHASVLICTAISGGTLTQRLDDAAAQFGTARIALDLQRVCMDFPLPSPSGEGHALTQEQLRQLRKKHNANVYFSEELCARYFTYTQEERTHFVLFDDAETMRRKIRIGTQRGIAHAFLTYQESADILGKIFGNG